MPNTNSKNFPNLHPNAQGFLFPIPMPNPNELGWAPGIFGPNENWVNTGMHLIIETYIVTSGLN